MRFLFSLLLLAGAFAQNLITLPGLPANFTQNMYSGYLTVNPSTGRNLFHVFIESQRSPSTDPLVLWLTGGPGCSGLSAMFGENGPFFINPDAATLRANAYTWTQETNVIFVESPSGVGYSYSKKSSDYITGDAQTSQDLTTFMQQFLLTYPQYQGREFWITGESYAGHYAPNLAKSILLYNANGGQPQINLVGMQVGNPWTDPAIDQQGVLDMLYYHAIISNETYQGITQYCNFSSVWPGARKVLGMKQFELSSTCDQFQMQMQTDLALINPYEILSDVCLSSNSTATTSFRRRLALKDEHPDPDPCIDSHLTTYLNSPQVIKAIGATATPFAWQECTNRVLYSETDIASSMLPVWTWLLTQTYVPKLRMLVYSGDIDSVCPFPGTRAWFAVVSKQLSLKRTTQWHPWLDSTGQTGGYSDAYTSPDGHQLTWASVRDAGHMVPYVQPLRSWDLFSRFLNGEKI